MKVVKLMLIVNCVTLGINGVIVWLTIVKAFPPILGIVLFVGCLAGLVWFSCLVNGKLPVKKPQQPFYSASTEEVERL